MKLYFKRIDIEGFKCFTERVSLNLAPARGLHFLRGRNVLNKKLGANGVGKSSIFDALTWCLFGRTVGGLRNPDIEPWEGSGRTAVSITIGKHTVTRTTKPNRLTLDGGDIDQAALERRLHLNIDVFCHTILLGQGQPLFLDLTPKAKLDLISEVMNLDRWDRRSEYAASRAAAFQAMSMTLDMNIGAAERELENLNVDYLASREGASEWETKLLAVRETAQSKIKELQAKLDKVKQERDEAEARFDLAASELRPIQEELSVINSELTEAHSNRERFKHELKQMESGKCPTCGQPLKDHARELAKVKKALAIVSKGIEVATTKAEALRKSRDTYRDQFDEAHAKYKLLAPQVAELEVSLATQKRLLDSTEENPYAQQAERLRKRISATKKRIADIRVERKKLARRTERAAFWIKGFKEVKLYIIGEVLKDLELRTNAMLGEMGLSGWTVSYVVETETKSGTTKRGLAVLIQSPKSDKPVRWEVWSGGEGQRLRVIGSLALSEALLQHAGVEPNIEVLDEPTRHLSQGGVRDLVEALADRAERLGRTVWLIDHHAIESGRFAGSVTVIKEEGSARIEA